MTGSPVSCRLAPTGSTGVWRSDAPDWPPACGSSTYYSDTIAECVSPQTILEVLRRSGFVDVERGVTGGLLSDYTETKPPR
jgi:hypothetical protein